MVSVKKFEPREMIAQIAKPHNIAKARNLKMDIFPLRQG